MPAFRTVVIYALAAAAAALAVPACPAATGGTADGAACADIQDRLLTADLFRRCLARTPAASPVGGYPPAETGPSSGLLLASASGTPASPANPAPAGSADPLAPKGLDVVKLVPGGSPSKGSNAEEAPYPVPGLAHAPLRFISLKPVHFETDKAVLSDTAKAMLDRIARYLGRQSGLRRVLLYGYADFNGSQSYNYQLSLRRTRVVEDYLVSQGIAAGLLHGVAYGKRRPVDQSWQPEGRARNRRVELYAVVR